MLKPQNIGWYDQLITVKSVTDTVNNGEQVKVYANLYVDVPAREVKSRTIKNEQKEEMQIVGRQTKAFVIREFDRTINDTMIVSYQSQDYHITDVYPYGFDRANIVIECISRDND